MLQALYKQIAKSSKVSAPKVARILRGVGLLLADNSVLDLMKLDAQEIGKLVHENIKLGDDDNLTIADAIAVYSGAWKLLKGQQMATVLFSLNLIIQLAKQSEAEGIELPLHVEAPEPTKPGVGAFSPPKRPPSPPPR